MLLLALVYQLLLSDYDINYYLAVKPPQWRVALIWAGLIALAWLIGWLIFSTLAAMVASALVGTAGSFFIHITVESESMKALLVTLSLVSMFGFILSFTVTFISTSVLSFLIIKVFLDNGLGGKEPGFFPAAGARQFSFALNPRVLVWGLIAGFIAALLTVNGLIQNLEFEDRTEIMAHSSSLKNGLRKLLTPMPWQTRS